MSSSRSGMTTSLTETDDRAVEATVTESDIVVRLTDGRTISVPLAWFPRLLAASPAERAQFELIGDGIGLHWPSLDEDLSVAGMGRGVRPQTPVATERLPTPAEAALSTEPSVPP